MSRYTGPRVRVLRKLGTELPGLTRKHNERRPYPPGQHGQARRKLSEYGLRLIEKQKLRMNYGVSERQLVSLMKEARAGKGNTGERLLEFLERRLDNVVFRAGFARTIPAARQLVCHGHVLVDGHRVDIASFRVRVGQQISIIERSRKSTAIAASLATPLPFPTPWLEVSAEKLEAKMTMLPPPDSIPFPLSVQRVIEFYSQRV
ncbi:MAG: 30S ribosomal protein S4 [Polyangiaceae bacterium]